jgi:CHASE2 domain-containing sensor protein
MEHARTTRPIIPTVKRPPLWGIAVALALWGVAGTAAYYGHWWPLVAMAVLAVVAGVMAIAAVFMVRGSAKQIGMQSEVAPPRRHIPAGPRAAQRKKKR